MGYEGVEVDCPDCGGDAIANDSGVYCPDCNNQNKEVGIMLYEGGVTEGTEEVETEDVFDMGGSLPTYPD